MPVTVEILAWSAVAHAGVSGEMVRDLMVEAVEKRFGGMRTPHPVEWLSDNGSAYIARETATTAAALGLRLAFTPVRSPQSNGISEAFVKTLKRDYARNVILPDAETVLALLTKWFDDYNEIHRTPACASCRRASSGQRPPVLNATRRLSGQTGCTPVKGYLDHSAIPNVIVAGMAGGDFRSIHIRQ